MIILEITIKEIIDDCKHRNNIRKRRAHHSWKSCAEPCLQESIHS